MWYHKCEIATDILVIWYWLVQYWISSKASLSVLVRLVCVYTLLVLGGQGRQAHCLT